MDTYKFLHCIPMASYLEGALRDGLMYTEHEVALNLSDDPLETEKFKEEMTPFLMRRLGLIGVSYDDLSEFGQQKAIWGISGKLSADVPMICMTEVPEGRNINSHRRFGSYGLVISKSWMAKHGADRVVYIGHNSSASRKIFRALSMMIVSNLQKDGADDIVYEQDTFTALLDVLTHIQVRDHLGEAEWRITGRTGLLGAPSDTGQRIPIALDDIEYVFVPRHDLPVFGAVVKELTATQPCKKAPQVICFPDIIPTERKNGVTH